MRRFLVFLICCAGAPFTSGSESLGPLPEELMPGLRSVIQAALEGSSDIEMLVYTEREAEGKRLAHRSAVLPKFGSAFSFRQEEDQDANRSTGFEDRVVYRVTLSQPLYHWGAKQAERKVGELIYDMEQLSAEGTGLSVVKKVRADYMSLVIAKQDLEAAATYLQMRQGNLDFQRRQYEAGAVSSSVVERVEFEVERLELAHLRELDNWENKLLELSAYANVSVDELDSAIAESIPRFEPLSEESIQDLERHFDEGLEQDLVLRRRELDLEIERKRLLIERKALRPKLDAELGMSSNALDRDGVRREQEFLYFGLSVGWNIFDGFRTKGRTMEAVNRLARAERSLDVVKKSTLRSYSRIVSTLNIARRSLLIEERALKYAEEQLEATRKGIDEQRIPGAELAGALRSHDQASVSAQRARISYLTALGEFTLLLGLDPIAFDKEI